MKNYGVQLADDVYQKIVNMISWYARPENVHRKDAPTTMKRFMALMAMQGYIWFRDRDMDGEDFPLGKLPRGRRKRTL